MSISIQCTNNAIVDVTPYLQYMDYLQTVLEVDTTCTTPISVPFHLDTIQLVIDILDTYAQGHWKLPSHESNNAHLPLRSGHVWVVYQRCICSEDTLRQVWLASKYLMSNIVSTFVLLCCASSANTLWLFRNVISQ